jgi:hypothetical protein
MKKYLLIVAVFICSLFANAQDNAIPKVVLANDFNSTILCKILTNSGIEILEKDASNEIKINLGKEKKMECYLRWDSKKEFLTFSNYLNLKDEISKEELDKLVADTNTFSHYKAQLLVEDNVIYGIVFTSDFWIKDDFVEEALLSALDNFKREFSENTILNFVKE